MTYESDHAPQPHNNFNQLTQGQPHEVARTQVHKQLAELAITDLGLPSAERFPVDGAHVSWSVDYPEYNPPMMDVPRGTTRFRKPDDYPDPADPNQATILPSLETPSLMRDAAGRPLNPIGRTGIQGRGILNKWGPNPAADPIVTREEPETGTEQVLMVERADTGELALPGGKVDPGETPAETAGRELGEEAGVTGVQLDFSNARVVFAGYADDSRNTDNAWMETTALHLHLSPEQARNIQVVAGSDAAAVRWVPMEQVLAPGAHVFSAHSKYLGAIAQS